MSELADGFGSLPAEYQSVLRLAQDTHNIQVTPLQELKGGQTGARLYLVSVTSPDLDHVEHFVLKLDHKSKKTTLDEFKRHAAALSQAPPDFAREHIAKLAFDRVELEGSVALFYTIAGQSLHNYRPLASYQRQTRLELIFRATNELLLAGWNAASTFRQAVHPQELLAQWLGYRLQPGGNIERFVEDVCHIHPDTTGLLILGNVFPNPLAYAREIERWGAVRPIDAIIGFQHGDLNIGNILARFTGDGEELAGYYLIDFALYKAEMPLLYDQRYLEMSYLIRELSRVPFPKWVDLVTRFAEQDIVDAQQVPIELAGACAVIAAGRRAFDGWVQNAYPSLSDDLWGQFWLAGVAVGLNYCNKAIISTRERLAGLIFAAAHLKRYHAAFGVPLPIEVEHLDIAGQSSEPPGTEAVTRFPTARPRHNLPAQITPFVGRESEITALSGLLSDPNLALVSVVAPGGMGKTRLALELGSRAADQFQDGVFFVELAPINDSAHIIPAVAEAIGYQFQQNGRSQKQQVLDYLENKQVLLILDNFEHLLDGAGVVTEILTSAPRLKILVTSRQRLNQPGETLFTLQGLTLPDSDLTVDASRYAAIELFQQAARRARPDFVLTAENLSHVIRICWLVQGMPLGILLAAPWVTVLSAAEIAAEIQRGLDILATEGAELPERLRSIRAVFDHAWSMMTEAEQQAFRKLAVFRGGFTREAGHAVAGAGLLELQALINRALITRDADQGRYQVHELLRQYAAEKLQDAGETIQTRHDHTHYYLPYLAAQAPYLKGAGQLSSLNRIEADFENIREGWRDAVENREYDLLKQALEGMHLYCLLRSRLEDGKALFDRARQGLAPEPGHAPHPAWLALEVRFYSTTDSQAILRERLETALALARERDDELEMAFCLHNLGTIAHYVDQNPPQAIAYYQECAAIYRRLGEKYYLAQNLSTLGEAYQLLDQTELTLKYVNEARQLQREIGDQMGESETLRALGMTAYQTGDYDAADGFIGNASAIQLRTNYVVGQATSNLFIGYMAFMQAETARGRELVEKGLTQALDIVDYSTQAWCYAVLGWFDCAAGDYASAEQVIRKAEAIETDPFRQTGAGNPFLRLHIGFARSLLAGGQADYAAAKRHLLQPLKLAVATSSQPFMTLFVALAAILYAHDGRLEPAAELLGLALKQPVKATGWMAHWVLLNQARAELQAELGQAAFEAACSRGKALDLKATAERVLREIEAAIQSHE